MHTYQYATSTMTMRYSLALSKPHEFGSGSPRELGYYGWLIAHGGHTDRVLLRSQGYAGSTFDRSATDLKLPRRARICFPFAACRVSGLRRAVAATAAQAGVECLPCTVIAAGEFWCGVGFGGAEGGT